MGTGELSLNFNRVRSQLKQNICPFKQINTQIGQRVVRSGRVQDSPVCVTLNESSQLDQEGHEWSHPQYAGNHSFKDMPWWRVPRHQGHGGR